MTESRCWSWRSAIARSGMPTTMRTVLWAISFHMNEHGTGCYPSQETIAEETGLKRETVNRYLVRAMKEGWLEVSQHGFRGQKWRRNEYVARWPERELASATVEEKGSDRGSQPFGPKGVIEDHKGSDRQSQKVVTEDHTNPPENPPRNPPVIQDGRARANIPVFEEPEPDPFVKTKPGLAPDEPQTDPPDASGAPADDAPKPDPGSEPDALGSIEPDLLPACAPPTRPAARRQKSYPADFEAAWRDYPRTPTMSKQQAYCVWKRTPLDERDRVRRAIPHFARYCRDNADWYSPVHFCRFVSQGRYEGFEHGYADQTRDRTQPRSPGRRQSLSEAAASFLEPEEPFDAGRYQADQQLPYRGE